MTKFISEEEHGLMYITAKDSKGANRLIISIDPESSQVMDIAPCVNDIKLNELDRLVGKAKQSVKAWQYRHRI